MRDGAHLRHLVDLLRGRAHRGVAEDPDLRKIMSLQHFFFPFLFAIGFLQTF